MTKTEMRRVFEHCSAAQEQITWLKEEIERAFSVATGGAINYKADVVQASTTVDAQEEGILKLVALKERLLNLYIAELERRVDVMDGLLKLQDAPSAQILYCRYIAGQSILDIANENRQTYEWTRRRLNDALDYAAKNWEKSE